MADLHPLVCRSRRWPAGTYLAAIDIDPRSADRAQGFVAVSAVVAGAAGGFGQIFCDLLFAGGHHVIAVDARPTPNVGRVYIDDITAASPELCAELSTADVLMLCIPEAPLFEALPRLLPFLPSGALVVDITSVKTRYAHLAMDLRGDLELCSVEPLFASDVSFTGQQLLITELRTGPRTTAFLKLLHSTGADIIAMSADAIDRHAAATQVAAHAALIAYGQTLRQLNIDSAGPNTALQRALLALLARIVTRDPATYWHIQCDNPYATTARSALQEALTALNAAVIAGDRGAFTDLITIAGDAVGPRVHQLAARSTALLESLASCEYTA